ncbi:tyrosine-type recombinase/integrase [Microcoleus sp. B7-D4]|uniref:tyrosine-type recombinase/integrase n=1 Tax=Microcoleus sp. B7-D4 TaxID=2818696 RepID=UPI004040B4F3
MSNLECSEIANPKTAPSFIPVASMILHSKRPFGMIAGLAQKVRGFRANHSLSSGISGSSPLSPTVRGAAHHQLSEKAMSRDEALQMVKRRIKRAGLPTLFSNHSFRATGIASFLENGGQLETAQRIAGHADSRTAKGYDRRATRLELSEIVRVKY